MAFDLLAEGDEKLLKLPYAERRARLEEVVEDPVQLTPMTDDREGAGGWLTGQSEGVVAKEADAPYLPGERKGMVKIKRLRTLDAVVAAFRFGKAEDTVGSLILGLYDKKGELHIVGHTSGFTREAEEGAAAAARAVPDRRARLRRAEPLEVGRGARVGGPAARSSSARSASTTSPATASATARSSYAGGTTRIRGSARWTSCALSCLIFVFVLGLAAPASAVELVTVTSFPAPTHVTAPRGDYKRLFVVQQEGMIGVVDGARKKAKPFLDIRKFVTFGGERGLLSMAFAPDYKRSRKFYVYYTSQDVEGRALGDIVVEEYKRSKRNPNRASPGKPPDAAHDPAQHLPQPQRRAAAVRARPHALHRHRRRRRGV